MPIWLFKVIILIHSIRPDLIELSFADRLVQSPGIAFFVRIHRITKQLSDQNMNSRLKTASGLVRRIAWVGLLIVSIGLPAIAQEYSPAPPQQQALRDLCANGIISIRALRFLVVFLLAAIAIFFIQIDLRLKRAGWSLKRALSEPKRLTFVGDQPQQSNFINVSNLKLDGSGRPIEVVTLEVSISRTIALVGAGSMVIVYLGFGVLSVYHFGRTCSLPPGTAQATGFIWTGLAFFVPYIANKVIFFFGRILDLFSKRGGDYNSIADFRGTSRGDSLQNLKAFDRQPPEASPQDLPQTSALLNSDIYVNKFSEKNLTVAPEPGPSPSDSKDVLDTFHPEMPSIETPHIDASNLEMPTIEMPHLDISHLEGLKIEMPHLDISHSEMPSIETLHIDASNSEMPTIEMPHLDISHLEGPKIEMPHLDISHSEMQNAELSNSDISHLEMPNIEIPHLDAADLEMIQPEILQIPAIANPGPDASIAMVAPVVESAEPEIVVINESIASGSNELNKFAYSKAFLLISEFEGFFGQASLISDIDPGVYVVGYGFTSVQGQNVTQADTMSHEQANILLEQAVKDYAKYLASRIPFWLEMTLTQQSALIAFAWNMGASFFEAPGFDVISNYLKLRDWQSVSSAICLYNNYGADPIPSLLRRRQAESSLWQAGLVELNETSLANESSTVNGVNGNNKTGFSQVQPDFDALNPPQLDLNDQVNSAAKLAIIDKVEPGEAAESIQPESPALDRDISSFNGENLFPDLNDANASNNEQKLNGDLATSTAKLDSENQISASQPPSSQPIQLSHDDSRLAELDIESRSLDLELGSHDAVFSTVSIHESSVNDRQSTIVESLAVEQSASLETSPEISPETSLEVSPEPAPGTSPETSLEALPGASPGTSPGSSPETSPEISSGEQQNKLVVSYFDNLLTNGAQNYRDSFSNCCAMLAGYWRRIEAANDYNAKRESFGSSAVIISQQQALGHFGLASEFIDDATVELIKSEIDAGRPVAVCWLCYGPFNQPAGGGHWSVVTGYDNNGFFVNDPFGQCDLEHGGYSEMGDGSGKYYGFEYWLPRWRLGGGVGWALTCHSLA